jgi:tetratricopeptide (TPR) repeat protein
VGTIYEVGDQIQGRWEIFKILEGGAGIVYVVYDHAFHESFAVKTFKDEVFACSPLIADRFSREVLAWLRLDIHANVTQARMMERIDGKPFLFLEYVSGGDLGSWIGTPRLTEDLTQVLRFAIQFCDGMIHAVSRGIRVHRDIKPRNCLITTDGVLKVTDFGLAKLLEDDQQAAGPASGRLPQKIDLTISAVGTCTHMAPEQFENTGHVDARVDIYAFGVMLYQMVKGDLPFIGEDWQQLERLHKTQAPPYLSKTDKRLASLVQTCLAKNPSERPSDFTQVRGRLAEIYASTTGSPFPDCAKGAALNAVQWNNKGSSLDNLKRHAESIVCYDTALKLDPLLVSAWFNKGVALFETRQIPEALRCYEQALTLDPKAEQVWSNKGVVLKSLGKIEEALACYERALKCNPRYPNAWVNKGVALRTMGKNEQALACYDHALRLNPGHENAWTNKGNILYSLKRYAESIDCYDQALSLNPDLDLAWLNRAMALSALGRHQESLNCCDKAIEINRSLEQAWLLRGTTLVNAFHRYGEAVPYFEEAERLGSRDATHALALCRTAVGKS